MCYLIISLEQLFQHTKEHKTAQRRIDRFLIVLFVLFMVIILFNNYLKINMIYFNLNTKVSI